MNEVRTTFVPRRPTLASPQVAPSRGPDFIALTATFIFVASALAAGGVYAWRWTLGQQIEGQAAQLEKARESFDLDLVEKASILNDRIEAADEILDGHLAPTELLEIFEQFTIRTIAFQAFTAIHQPDDSVAINATGVGQNFESVVLQSDWFGEGPEGDGARLRDVVFSRLGENDLQQATFNFSATIPADRILFSRSITQLPAPSGQRSGAPAGATTSPAVQPSAGAGVAPRAAGGVIPPITTTVSTSSAPAGARTAPPGSVTF